MHDLVYRAHIQNHLPAEIKPRLSRATLAEPARLG
jgi:hypothetical protein